MNVDLAQTICVVCHGSAWLRDGGDPAPRFESFEIFELEKSMCFEFEQSAGSTIEAADSATWMTQLAQREVDRLWLVKVSRPRRARQPRRSLMGALLGRPKPPLPPDPEPSVTLVGSGTWEVLGSSPLGHELWLSHREDRDDVDGKRWEIRYTGRPVSDVSIEPPAIEDAQSELLAALREARQFAAGVDSFWVRKFSNAIALGSSTIDPIDPRRGFLHTLLPRNGYSLAARRLFAISAKTEEVFGGMGSWADQSYGPGSREVTARLYAAMENGFVSAVNSPLEHPPTESVDNRSSRDPHSLLG